MSHFVLSAWVTFFSTSFLALLVFLKRKARLHRVFFAYSLCISLWALCFTQHTSSLDAARSLLWSRPLHVFAAFIPVLFLGFTFALISTNGAQRALLRIVTVVAIFFAGLSAVNSPLFISGVRPRPGLDNLVEAGPLYLFFFAFFAICTVYGLWLIWRAYLRATGVLKAQLRYLLLGSLIGYSGGIDNFLIVYDIRLPVIAPYGTYAVPLYVLIAAYAIVRYRFMDVSVALTRFAAFILFYLPLLVLPIIGGSALQPLLAKWFGVKWWMAPAAFEALFAVGGLTIYRYVGKKAEDRLLREQREIHDTLLRASRDMTQFRQMRHLVRVMTSVLTGKMRVSHAALYLIDEEGKGYHLMSSRSHDVHPTETRVGIEDPLVRYWKDRKTALIREEMLLQHQQEVASDLKAVADQLHRLGAECAVPSFSRGNLLGFVLLGAKQSGQMYTAADLEILTTLANQAALAIENAKFYEAEEKRQGQMFQSAKLFSLGVMASSIGHQFNNRFHMECVTASTYRALIKSLDLSGVPDPIKDALRKIDAGLEKIVQDTVHGGEIAKDILNFSRPGKEGEQFTFMEMVTIAVDFARNVVKFEEFDFETVIPEALPTLVGNKSRLSDIFFNLIANANDAIKSREQKIRERALAAPEGEEYQGKIQIKATPFDRQGAPWLRIEISDNGVGIREEELEKLFVPFFTTKDNRGTGLGLFIVKLAIEKQGGSLEVRSTYGQGTTFTILLPGLKPEPHA